jgi:hypothetical protein
MDDLAVFRYEMVAAWEFTFSFSNVNKNLVPTMKLMGFFHL